jgi:hypothetical protein
VVVPPRSVFAAFKETAVDITPAIFHDAIAPDLGNVVVPFVLSEEQRARLAQDGVVVSPGVEKEFFTVYEQARYNNLPPFVTSDSLLHVYHLLFDKVLRTAERQSFIPLLHQLNEAMLAQTDAQYQALQGTEWEDAARRTVANAESISDQVCYFAVSSFGHAPVKIDPGDYVPDPRRLIPMFVEVPPLWLLSQIQPDLVPTMPR